MTDCCDQPKYSILCMDNKTGECSPDDIRCLALCDDLDEACRKMNLLKRNVPAHHLLRIAQIGELCKVDKNVFRVERDGTLDYSVAFFTE